MGFWARFGAAEGHGSRPFLAIYGVRARYVHVSNSPA